MVRVLKQHIDIKINFRILVSILLDQKFYFVRYDINISAVEQENSCIISNLTTLSRELGCRMCSFLKKKDHLDI